LKPDKLILDFKKKKNINERKKEMNMKYINKKIKKIE
jgi:hypothetical protein